MPDEADLDERSMTIRYTPEAAAPRDELLPKPEKMSMPLVPAGGQKWRSLGCWSLYQNGKIAFDSRGNACIKKMQATVKQFLPNHGGAENAVALGAQPYVPRSSEA